jgi:hypothetical protein
MPILRMSHSASRAVSGWFRRWRHVGTFWPGQLKRIPVILKHSLHA